MPDLNQLLIAALALATLVYVGMLIAWAVRVHLGASNRRVPTPRVHRSTWQVAPARECSADGGVVFDPATGDFYVTYGAGGVRS